MPTSAYLVLMQQAEQDDAKMVLFMQNNTQQCKCQVNLILGTCPTTTGWAKKTGLFLEVSDSRIC